MFQNWIKQKERHRSTSKVSFALIFSVLSLTLGFAAVKAPLKSGVQYTVITDLPETMILDKTYTMQVDCENIGTMPYEVWAEITITGPEGFNNRDIFIVWTTYDRNLNLLGHFTLGRDGMQEFTGEDTITWTGKRTLMMPGDYRIHMLDVTVYGSAPLGNYKVDVTVLGEGKPVEANVIITPKALNVKSKGQWITAKISLPEPYKEEKIDISSVKLWYKDTFVSAEWGTATEHSLIVKFPRTEVTKMLRSAEGNVQLIVTGLVDNTEFSGADTIIVLTP